MRFLDYEPSFLIDCHVVQHLKALRQSGDLELLMRAKDGFCRHLLSARPVFIAPNGGKRVGLEVVADDSEVTRLGQGNVFSALLDGRIGVIDDEWLLCRDTELQKEILSVAGLQQIETDPHMGVEEPLFVEGGFARGLDTDEDNGFHTLNIDNYAANNAR